LRISAGRQASKLTGPFDYGGTGHLNSSDIMQFVANFGKHV
jgi:hypothetical protein